MGGIFTMILNLGRTRVPAFVSLALQALEASATPLSVHTVAGDVVIVFLGLSIVPLQTTLS